MVNTSLLRLKPEAIQAERLQHDTEHTLKVMSVLWQSVIMSLCPKQFHLIWGPYLFIFTFSNVRSKATVFWIPVLKQKRQTVGRLNTVQASCHLPEDAVFPPHSPQLFGTGCFPLYHLPVCSFLLFRNNLNQMYWICLLPQMGHLRLLGSLFLTCGTLLP